MLLPALTSSELWQADPAPSEDATWQVVHRFNRKGIKVSGANSTEWPEMQADVEVEESEERPVAIEFSRVSRKPGCRRSIALASALPTRPVSACMAAAARTGSVSSPATASSASMPPADISRGLAGLDL